MKPFLAEQHLREGQLIAQKLVESMQSLDVKSCLTGLVMATVFAADASAVPLESVFQLARDMRAQFQAKSKLIATVDTDLSSNVERTGLIVVP